MISLICAKCKGLTNTAVCNHLDPIRRDGKANECYLRWENDKWVKGCAYEVCDPFTKILVDRYLEARQYTKKKALHLKKEIRL